MNARRLLGVVMAVVLAVGAAAQDNPEQEMKRHFEMMFRDVAERMNNDVRMLQEELQDPHLSETESAAVRALVEAHQEIARMSRDALQKIPAAAPMELEGMERELREMERELELLWLDRELAFAMRHIEMVEDPGMRQELEERAKGIFTELKEMAERRAELEVEKQELAQQVGAELQPRR